MGRRRFGRMIVIKEWRRIREQLRMIILMITRGGR